MLHLRKKSQKSQREEEVGDNPKAEGKRITTVGRKQHVGKKINQPAGQSGQPVPC